VLDLPSWPLRLVDTAGLHDTTDVVERLGIETSSRYLGQAALVLACGDDSASLAAAASAVRERTDAPVVTVRTKGDLVTDDHEKADAIVSARSGTGLRDLLQLVERRLSERHGDAVPDMPGLTRARHQRAVRIAATEVRAFSEAWRDDALPASVAAIHVRAAADALGELIGVVRVDDVLDAVFRRFCVGK
jgi:tRNA modification GTPase